MKGGLGGLIKQAQVLKLKMEQLQARLAQEEHGAEAGGPAAGGVVRVTVSGRQQVKALSFDPALAGDPALLEDLLLTALNRALDESRTRSEREMAALTGGANLPFGL
jgi:nucleoid-associated protein EbfC